MSESAIEWTDATWNPVTGCDRVSPGCAHCYALDLAARLKRMGQPRYQNDGDPRTSGPGFGVTLHPDKLDEPLRWRKPRMVFVNSMSDLFHEAIPFEFIDRVFATMAVAERHTFQVLTKRPERMREYMADREGVRHSAIWFDSWPLPNVWLGVSIENRRFVGRADVLRDTPAAVRFVSAEPLLGPLVPARGPSGGTIRDGIGRVTWWIAEAPDAARIDRGPGQPPAWLGLRAWEGLRLDGIDWLICGGESGTTHRQMRLEWVRDLRDECEASDTAFFFKQWGGRTPKAGGRLLDGREWNDMPTALVPA